MGMKDKPSGPEQQGGPSDPNDYDKRLRLLEECFCRFMRENATENVIGGGFVSVHEQLGSMNQCLQGIYAQLEPLRYVVPTGPKLDDDQEARRKYLVKGSEQPKWNGVAAVTIDESPVRYIGQSAPAGQALMAFDTDPQERSATP